MAMTLIEAAKSGSMDVMRQAVITTFARSHPLLENLPFQNIDGNALSFLREKALPDVGFRAVNEGLVVDEGEMEKVVESLAIAGGDIDVDKFILKTGGEQVREAQEAMKLVALAHEFALKAIKGDSVSDNKRQFDGLQKRAGTSGSQVVDAGSSSGGDALSLSKLDEAIDTVDNPTHLLLNKALARRFSAAARNTSVGGHIEFEQDEMGRRQGRYQGLPFIVMDPNGASVNPLPFTEASPGGGDSESTSLYVVSIGDGQFTGIQNEPPDVREVGELEDKVAERTRVEWYASLAVYHPRAIGRLRGIKDAAITA